MISWKLISKNRKKYTGIFGIIMVCVMIVTASFLYIMYASEKTQKENYRKYGDAAAVLYVDNEKSQIEEKLDALSEVKNYAGQSRYVASCANDKVMLHVMDFEAMDKINDIQTLDGKIIDAQKGIYLEKDLLSEKQVSEETKNVTLIVSEKEVSIPIGGFWDKKSFCEVASSSYANVYMDIKMYESLVGKCKPFDTYYIALSNPTSKHVSTFLQQFEGCASKNIIELVELEKKHSSQSFIYAVSFILIGLLGVVLGGLYNFTKGMLEENISQISFFRTLGLSRKEATRLYMQQILWIGGISEIIGLIAGTVLGNIAIAVQYGLSRVVIPNWWILLITVITSLILPYCFMSAQSSSLKNSSPIRLLLSYRNKGYNSDDDNIKKYLINTIVYGALFLATNILVNQLDENIRLIIKCIQVLIILNFVQYLCTIILAFIGFLSKFWIKTVPYVAMALRNTSRNKKKVSSILGIFILILAFDIGMYDVFYTIRIDTVDKVEQQYQGDAYISEYNQTEEVAANTLVKMAELEEIEHIETSCSRYIIIDGNQIEGYFLSQDEFSTFFNVKDVETSKKAQMPSNTNEVVIGKGLAMKGNIKVGDTIELIDDDLTYKVTVSTICNTAEYQGNVVFLNEKGYEHATNSINFIFREGVTSQEGIKKIYSLFDEDDVSIPKIISKQQLKEKYRQSAINGTMFIEVILFFITTSGVLMLLNQEVQFMKDRKREYALFHALGNNKGKLGLMYIVENICILVVCLLGGVFSGILLTSAFVDVATYTAGIAEVLSYHYDLGLIAKLCGYVASLYILCIVYVMHNMKKKVNVYDVTNE